MRRKEAQRLVEDLYLNDYLNLPDAVNATEVEARHFYKWLEQNRPEALEFRFSGASRYLIIFGWVRDVEEKRKGWD